MLSLGFQYDDAMNDGLFLRLSSCVFNPHYMTFILLPTANRKTNS